jgi:hypothetical protein
MGTSTTNDARQREWVAPRGFLGKAVSRRSVACFDEKQVRKHFAKIESPARGQAGGAERRSGDQLGDFLPETSFQIAVGRRSTPNRLF